MIGQVPGRTGCFRFAGTVSVGLGSSQSRVRHRQNQGRDVGKRPFGWRSDTRGEIVSEAKGPDSEWDAGGSLQRHAIQQGLVRDGSCQVLKRDDKTAFTRRGGCDVVTGIFSHILIDITTSTKVGRYSANSTNRATNRQRRKRPVRLPQVNNT